MLKHIFPKISKKEEPEYIDTIGRKLTNDIIKYALWRSGVDITIHVMDPTTFNKLHNTDYSEEFRYCILGRDYPSMITISNSIETNDFYILMKRNTAMYFKKHDDK